MEWLVGICLGIVVLIILLMLRNEMVFIERKKMLGIIHLYVSDLIINHPENRYQNYHDIYNDFSIISYDRMVWQFWKPVGSFYNTMFKKYDLYRFVK